MCGDKPNALVVFKNGLTACAKTQLGVKETNIKGSYGAFKEELAFYLGKFLGFNNVPAVVVSKVLQ